MKLTRKYVRLSQAITILMMILLVSSGLTVNASTPPVIPGDEEYHSDYGVLHSDTYVLYPYEKMSLDIGFSKYGEMIDGNSGQGLKYGDVDAFANAAVPESQWSHGWVIDIHYTVNNKLRNVWAYALYTDFSGPTGIGGNWRQKQTKIVAGGMGPDDMYGGRRTSGYAASDPIRLVYDGPRKAIYLLKTTIYDDWPGVGGNALVEITTQVVFNKVKKYVMEIKDIKRITDEKVQGPMQIEYSQRGEWDIGKESASESYAEFYNDLPTKYYKHPFYYPAEEQGPVTFDLCQMIDKDEEFVGFAAFWPPLISKWVTNLDSLSTGQGGDRPDILSTMETYEHMVHINSQNPQQTGVTIVGDNCEIKLPKEAIEYPRGAGEWSDEPWVFRKQGDDYIRIWSQTGAWSWDPIANKVILHEWSWEYEDNICIVFKREMMGEIEHHSYALECMPMFQEGEGYTTYGMLQEPKVPYVFAEWDFDLDYDKPENSTHQFRCVSVYGLTDNHNAVDPDMDDNGYFRIDKEVIYQLEEVFNPWDLKDAARQFHQMDDNNENGDMYDGSFRWAQKGPIDRMIYLQSHLHDKYGGEHDTLLLNHTVWKASKWGYYCNESEKVLLYDSDETLEPLLLERPVDYQLVEQDPGMWVVRLDSDWETDYADYDYYKVLYTTKLNNEAPHWFHNGRWEWLVMGESSLASDSLGAGMVSATWADWKNRETWLTGLDIEAEGWGPAIPHVMRRFNDMYEGKDDFYYDIETGDSDYRTAFRDDWCTSDTWDGTTTIYPYAVSSSNIMVVGGPIVNLAAEYFNDYTDALIYTEYGDGYYAPGCWARTTQPSLGSLTHRETPMDMLPKDELWYNSACVGDDYGYAIVSTYKDINGTTGFIVYGYTAEDTYYTCYALRGGGLALLQFMQEGVTTILLEIDYRELHPVKFHIKECLGPFTECTGADTNFKTPDYYESLYMDRWMVYQDADFLGLTYKLVEIDYCAQIHPDP